MIDETKIVALLEAQNELLREVLDQLQGGLTVKREYTKNRHAPAMSEDEKDSLNEEIDLDWWFTHYGEDVLPAKYMDRQKLGFAKREVDYMHKRLAEIAEYKPLNEAGTHIFTSVGKKYCKTEKNTLNCFAFIPITEAK